MATSPELRLRRFLHITSETNVYQPGCRFFQKYFNRQNVPGLNELIEAKNQQLILDTIVSVHKANTSVHTEAALYIVSEIAKDAENREKALAVAKILCKKAESFIIFIKFAVEMKPSIGFGRKFRRFVREWYLSKDMLPLAEVIGAMNRYRGWRHSDIIKLGHIKCTEPGKAASFKFATYGAEEMRKHYGEIKEAEKVVSYLSTVEAYRKNKDPGEVAAKIESYMLGKEHIDSALLKDKIVWLALLRQMPVIQVLDHLQYMNKRKLFRGTRSWDPIFVDTVVEALVRPGAIKDGVTANKVFKTLFNFENTARIKLELASKLKQLTKKPPVICNEVSKALLELMDMMYEKVKPTGKKYYIAVELSGEMTRRRCKMSRYIMLVEAAAFIAHYFYRTEANVKVVTFGEKVIKPYPMTKEATVKDIIEALKAAQQAGSTAAAAAGEEEESRVDPDELAPAPPKNNAPATPAPVSGATPKEQPKQPLVSSTKNMKIKQKVQNNIINRMRKEIMNDKDDEDTDVCIIIKSSLDNNSLVGSDKDAELNDEKSKLRFVLVNLCGTPKNTKYPDLKNVLIMLGFDEKFVEVISSFAKGCF